MTTICRGLCKGDRGATDSPASVIRDPVRRRAYVVCNCCSAQLREAPEYTRTADGKRIPARPPNLRPELVARSLRFVDDICGYDHVLLADVRPAQS